ncbi:MAG TPA: carboxypeptidase-like regulatory domain-containing protein, partial [Gemmatimonadaceae bacterium]
MRGFLALVTCVAILPLSLSGQPTGTVEGTVSDSTGAPVVGAELSIDGSILSASSDERGKFRFTGVPTGAVTLRARRLGFEP